MVLGPQQPAAASQKGCPYSPGMPEGHSSQLRWLTMVLEPPGATLGRQGGWLYGARSPRGPF